MVAGTQLSIVFYVTENVSYCMYVMKYVILKFK